LILVLLLGVAGKGKLFFLQRRPGLSGKLFTIVKFRTMNDRKDSTGTLLPDGVRLTSLGKFMRNTSMDEMPQLLNVIRGDMSLVGPRPLLEEYLPLYSARQSRRHEVKPGLTGWAQVNGRNALTWEQKFDYDVWYVDHYNFLMDCRIIGLTVKKVFKSEGIRSGTSATMEKFSNPLP
jgi:undecaprenyl phosphate N,N'-diacetylbacillosamine 1-phosphate transferase